MNPDKVNPDKVILVSGGSMSPESLRLIKKRLDSVGNEQRKVLVLEATKAGDITNAPRIDLGSLFKPKG